jgi:hypothetical protein
LLDAYPRLQHFRVRGGQGLEFGRLRHEALQSLVIETGGLGAEVVRGVLGSDFPALVRLELWLGTDGYGRTTTLAELEPILKGGPFPRLAYLGLRNCERADDLAKALAQSPIVGRIKELDLSLGDLGDEGARALLQCPGVASLDKLILNHHYISSAVMAELRALGVPIEAGEPEKPYDWDDEEHRYIAVGE